MPYACPKLRRRPGHAWRFLATAAACAALAPAAQATNFTESTDYSNNPDSPTILGGLTPGSNLITGTINTFGDRVGPHGERTNQDVDYMTFTVPNGYALTHFLVSDGTSIETTPRDDLLFLGLASGGQVNVNPSFTSAAGLLGWTLVSQSRLGSDILPAIGAATYPGFPVPGATGFTGPLGAGTYTLWLGDGDETAHYSFNLITAAVPEPATWAMMILGFGMIGAGLRYRRGRTSLHHA